MKKLLTCFVIAVMLIGCIIPLASCKKDDGIPKGMQLVRGSDELGYYFYAPEEWTVSNTGNVACVYTADINTASVTFVEAKMPTQTDTDIQGDVGFGTEIDEYFEADIPNFPFPIVMKETCVETNFGNAESAYKFVYSYEYGAVEDNPATPENEKKSGLSMTCKQIFIKHAGRFFIFTYTAPNNSFDKENTYYQHYINEKKIDSIKDNFKFVDRAPSTGDTPDYPRDEDGYILVTDKKATKALLYLPDSFEVAVSGATVTAIRADGTSVNLAPISGGADNPADYWKVRRADLEYICDSLTVATDSEGKEKCDLPVTVEGARWAFSYEYTYTLAGKTYSVYQVFTATWSDAYAITYTVEADSIDESHMAEALKILEKLEI